jgi:methylthioribose-1-phosphate isomerase
MNKSYYTIRWNGDSVSILDQRLLPSQEVYHTYTDYHDVIFAIREMILRGAPLIGVAAAYGIALAAKKSEEGSLQKFLEELEVICGLFEQTRPTAVNLFWAIGRMKRIFASGSDKDGIIAGLVSEANAIFNDDIAVNRQIGRNGSRFLSDGDTVMTHCNAGALATAGYGTALGVIRAAIEEGKKIKVICCETRPYLQGARLTAWELLKDGIDVTLICDSMAGHFMKEGKIQKIIVGADRIAANGDTANKIGTYTHSICAKEHHIPFYVAAPTSTLDSKTATGKDIIIEERPLTEVAFIGDYQIAPEGIRILNPAFDITPAANITAIITEKGVVENPQEKGISHLV